MERTNPSAQRDRRTTATRLSILAVFFAACVAGLAALAAAIPHNFVSGETLTADQLNRNFQDLEMRIASLEPALDRAGVRLGALEKATAPAAIVESFNVAVADGASVRLGEITSPTRFDLGWRSQHAAAGGACAAGSEAGDSGSHHVVLVRPSGVTCTNACASNAPGFPSCLTSVAIGQILPTQATAYTDVVATNYNYGCEDSQAAYDEVMGQGLMGQGLSNTYTAYCCCYKPRPP